MPGRLHIGVISFCPLFLQHCCSPSFTPVPCFLQPKYMGLSCQQACRASGKPSHQTFHWHRTEWHLQFSASASTRQLPLSFFRLALRVVPRAGSLSFSDVGLCICSTVSEQALRICESFKNLLMRDKQKAQERKQPRAQAAMIPQSLMLTLLQVV